MLLIVVVAVDVFGVVLIVVLLLAIAECRWPILIVAACGEIRSS